MTRPLRRKACREPRTAALAAALLILALFLAPKLAAAAPRVKDYQGDIGGKYRIAMKLIFEGATVTGSYYYEKHKKDLALSGKMLSDGAIVLDEYDPKGIFTGRFSGTIRPGGSIDGSWQNADGSKSYSFMLSPVGSVPDGGGESWAGAAGEWVRDSGRWSGATLHIGKVDGDRFSFSLYAQSGAHTGEVEGSAAIGGDRAVFDDGESDCRIVFTLAGSGIDVEASSGCTYYAGVGVYLGGAFERGKAGGGDDEIRDRTALVKAGVFRSADEERAFARLAGEHYPAFVESFHIVSEEPDLDGLGVVAHAGGVRGLYTIMEAIIMHSSDGRFYAAVIDGDVVRYFTNDKEYRNKRPRTIEKWRERFSDKPVIHN